jgi:hypothetical protein
VGFFPSSLSSALSYDDGDGDDDDEHEHDDGRATAYRHPRAPSPYRDPAAGGMHLGFAPTPLHGLPRGRTSPYLFPPTPLGGAGGRASPLPPPSPALSAISHSHSHSPAPAPAGAPDDAIKVYVRVRPPLVKELALGSTSTAVADVRTFQNSGLHNSGPGAGFSPYSGFPSTARVADSSLHLSLSFAGAGAAEDADLEPLGDSPLSPHGNAGNMSHGLGLGVYSYAFDGVFPDTAAQADVYATAVSPLVQSVLQGYNATVLAYGQTGTGKTYTMEGDTAFIASAAPAGACPALHEVFLDATAVGATPRAVCEIFAELARRQREGGARAVVTVSYVQIYNEALSDLLGEASGALQIRRDRKRGVVVEGASAHECGTVQEVLALIDHGAKYVHASTRHCCIPISH